MERLTEKRIAELVKEDDYSPMKLVRFESEPRLNIKGKEFNYIPDFLLDIEWEGKTFTFVAEAKTVSTPKVIEQAIWQITQYAEALNAQNTKNKYYPLIIIPYLSEEKADMLMKRSISGIGLSGNSLYIVPGELLVFRTRAEKNKYPSSSPIKNVYRGTSSIVARVFMSKSEYASVNEVLDTLKERGGRTSLSTVSKVIKELENDLLVSRHNGVKLLDPKGLLDKLRENYRPPQAARKTIGKVSDLPGALAKIAENGERNDFLCAIDEPRRYAVFPTVGAPTRVYVEYSRKALEKIEFEETDRFANIELIETSESPVYFDRRWELSDGAYYTSPLQTYLDLTTGGKRELDTAKQIVEKLLKLAY